MNSQRDDYEDALNNEVLFADTPNSDLAIRTIDYDPNGNPNSQRAIDLALAEGLTVVFPAANELLIDIDNEHSFQMFMKQMHLTEDAQ